MDVILIVGTNIARDVSHPVHFSFHALSGFTQCVSFLSLLYFCFTQNCCLLSHNYNSTIQPKYRYDLSPVNDYLYAIGMGLHHSGVEILGREYSVSSHLCLCLELDRSKC